MKEIGRWVIERSFEFAKFLEKKGICVSCNVSPIQLIQSSFVDDVIQAFDKYGLDSGSVALEITESILVESFGDISEKLRRLRDKGILIFLDDFGTGYSSLTYLKRLPLDVVKIDKSFVNDLNSGACEEVIAEAVINIAHSMNLSVIAEGIETEEQLEFLKQKDCDIAQGYLFSRPVPNVEAEKLMI
jgi:EAL domain-containing protein (putative c-di-GMP-specific phosphodiesterase class I)